jgi:hypothetical protein
MQTTCQQCTRTIQVQRGHRPKRYCSNACKQQAFRQAKLEKRRDALRQQWSRYHPEAQKSLEALMRVYGEDAAQLALDAIKHL